MLINSFFFTASLALISSVMAAENTTESQTLYQLIGCEKHPKICDRSFGSLFKKVSGSDKSMDIQEFDKIFAQAQENGMIPNDIASAHFDLADKNKDGKVDADEFKQTMTNITQSITEAELKDPKMLEAIPTNFVDSICKHLGKTKGLKDSCKQYEESKVKKAESTQASNEIDPHSLVKRAVQKNRIFAGVTSIIIGVFILIGGGLSFLASLYVGIPVMFVASLVATIFILFGARSINKGISN